MGWDGAERRREKEREEMQPYPIMSPQDDPLTAQLPGQFLDIVGGALETVIGHVGRLIGRGSVGAAITHHVGTDDSVAHLQQHGDLVAPADGEVRPPAGLSEILLSVLLGLRGWIEVWDPLCLRNHSKDSCF